jgi:Flp pilus assembly protein TadG
MNPFRRDLTFRIRSQKGQSLVEMALVSLVFFFLLFGILEFSRALYYYNTIVQNTRAAARWAVVNVLNNSDAADITSTRNIVLYGSPTGSGNPVLPGMTAAMVNVSVANLELDTSTPPKPISQKISVSVTGYPFSFIIPLAPSITIPAFETSLFTESQGIIPP